MGARLPLGPGPVRPSIRNVSPKPLARIAPSAHHLRPPPPERTTNRKGDDMAHHDSDKPYRVGVFRTVALADRAVRDLMAAGFSQDEIAVVSSDQRKEDAIPGVEKPVPDEEYPMRAIGAGGA